MSQLTAALVAKPAAAAPRQAPKLAGAQRKPAPEPQEVEADRLAAKASGGSGAPAAPPASPSSPAGEAPPAHALDVLRQPGKPLDAAVRSEMGSRLGHDFSRVRIHAGTDAAASASRLQAKAFTVGSHVVFNSGRYAPQSREGRELLAHELSHVVQQAAQGHPQPTIQFKKEGEKPEPGKFYQEVIDNVEYEKNQYTRRQKESGIGFHNINSDSLMLLLALCEAVDQNKKEEVPAKLDALLKKGLMVPFLTLSESLLTELSARLFEMGLEEDAARLRKAYSDDVKSQDLLSYDMGIGQRNLKYFARLVDGAIQSSSGETPDHLEASMHRFARAFVPLRDAYAAIDWKAVQQERESRSGWMVLRPNISREEWADGVTRQIERWLGGLEGLMQQAIDTARASFETGGDGATLLARLRDVMTKDLSVAIQPPDASKNMADVQFNISRTEMTGKGKGFLTDAFSQDKKKRRIEITTYDPDQEWVQEMRGSIGALYVKRLDQIAALGRIYGAQDLIPREYGGEMNEEAADNAASISRLKGGRLRLDSDDDWREFVWQKYQDLTNPPPPKEGETPRHLLKKSPAEALRAVMDVLYLYLKMFTMHAHYTNIYDIGASYINKPFPRALSGQLLHDCGVYAVRVAYILSLVRDKLKLKVRFVFMPAHVGLVIEGDDLPTYLAQNDSFVEVPKGNMDAAKVNFENFTRTEALVSKDATSTMTIETQVHPPGKRDHTQLLGELSAHRYVPEAADMPFRVVDIPGASTGKGAEQQLWNTYEASTRSPLFGKGATDKNDRGYLFHQRYLGLIEERNKQFNSLFLPFWNADGPNAWGDLREDLQQKQTKGEATAATLLEPVTAYAKIITASVKTLDDADKHINDLAKSITSSLQGNDRLKVPGGRIALGDRAASMFDEDTLLQDYRDKVNGVVHDMTQKPEATWKIDDLLKRLQPPFFPFGARKRAAE